MFEIEFVEKLMAVEFCDAACTTAVVVETAFGVVSVDIADVVSLVLAVKLVAKDGAWVPLIPMKLGVSLIIIPIVDELVVAVVGDGEDGVVVAGAAVVTVVVVTGAVVVVVTGAAVVVVDVGEVGVVFPVGDVGIVVFALVDGIVVGSTSAVTNFEVVRVLDDDVGVVGEGAIAAAAAVVGGEVLYQSTFPVFHGNSFNPK